MALYIEIEKMFEKDNIGYYHVVTENFGGANFYIGIDKKLEKVYCYLKNDFSISARIIDFNNPDERIGDLPGISASVLGKIFMTARKVFKLGEYPQYLDYAA